MTKIRKVDKDALDGIITRGRPAGYWMAQSARFPVLWTGVVATGEITTRHHGTFPEVITWLQVQQGIEQKGTRIIDADSRERIWQAGVSPEIPVRIEGAEVTEWKEAPVVVMGMDGTPVSGADADTLTRARRRGGAAVAAQLAERDEQIIRLHNAGATYDAIAAELGVVPSTVYERVKKLKARGEKLASRRDQAAVEARDGEILKLALSGLMWIEIAERLGVTAKVVSHRIQIMRSRGLHIPNRARLEAEAKNRERDEQTIRLVQDGMQLSGIARVTGEQKRAVSRRLARLREEGRI